MNGLLILRCSALCWPWLDHGGKKMVANLYAGRKNFIQKMQTSNELTTATKIASTLQFEARSEGSVMKIIYTPLLYSLYDLKIREKSHIFAYYRPSD